ncbi:hypothetical protein ACF06X_34340 [Streptomyces sp. NPDC015346]|uniref:hypothetical protein n=1 Tax=Streptomyces sp. NPDC015346 TaxID=3364954 RepID=UPI0036FCDCE9
MGFNITVRDADGNERLIEDPEPNQMWSVQGSSVTNNSDATVQLYDHGGGGNWNPIGAVGEAVQYTGQELGELFHEVAPNQTVDEQFTHILYKP